MSDDSYWVQLIIEDKPPVRSVVDRCIEEGLTTTPEGSTTKCAYYTIDGDRTTHDEGGDDIDTVIDQIAAARMGRLRFWDATGMALTLAFSNIDEQAWNTPRLLVQFTTLPLSSDAASEAVVADRIDTIIDLTTWITDLTAPTYGWSSLRVGQDPDAGVKPTGDPISDTVEQLSWLTVMGPDVVAEFGGHDVILDGPAWRVERLPSDHVIIVDRPHPTRGDDSASMTSYLLQSNGQ